MASNDVAVTKADIENLKVYIDGRIAGIEKRIDGVEKRIDGVEKHIDQAISEVKAEIRVNAAKVDVLKDSMHWGFATLAIVVALVGFSITLAPMFREMFRERKKYMTHDDVREIIREEFTKLKGNPV